jgi:UDPglucose--hexose-1-phosphate uridylyltransferase
VFENDFPAILPQAALPAVSPHPLLQAQTLQGASDVVVFHPRHDLTLPRLKLEEIEVIIKEWTKLYLRRGQQEGIKYVQIFEV